MTHYSGLVIDEVVCPMNHNLPSMLSIEELDKYGDVFGTKVKQLGVLSDLDVPIVDGFVVTQHAFLDFITHHNLHNKILVIINNIADKNPELFEESANQIKRMILHHTFESGLEKRLKKAVKKLNTTSYSISQSATNPLLGASLMNREIVKGQSVLMDRIRYLWAESVNPKVIASIRHNHSLITAFPALIIRAFEKPLVSGDMFSRSHLSKRFAMIQAFPGIAPSYVKVSREPVPQEFLVYRKSGQMISKELVHQSEELSMDRFGHVVRVKNSFKEGKALLSDKEVEKLAIYGNTVHNHFLSPQKISFVKTKKGLRVFATSDMEHTTEVDKKEKYSVESLTNNLKKLFAGIGASPGIVSAPVNVINNPNGKIKINPATKDGFILFSTSQSPVSFSSCIT